MIVSILLIASGAFVALYCTNKPFRTKVHDLLAYSAGLFKRTEEQSTNPVEAPQSTTSTPEEPPAKVSG